MKRALIVAYYFPPIAASGSMRPLAFCHHLHAFGWATTVLTADPTSVYPPMELDSGLARRIPSGTSVERVSYRDPVALAISARDWLRRRHARPTDDRSAPAAGRAASAPGQDSWRRRAKDLVLAHVAEFPDQQAAWIRPAVRRALDLARRERFDLVFATGKPWSGFAVGMRVAERLRVPFVADFRDPWTRNPYTDWRMPSLASRARRLEHSICATAASVVVNTEPLREQFAADYPRLADKFITITNGFDEWITGGLAETQSPVSVDGLELWHFGTVYGRRDPVALLTAVDELTTQEHARLKIRLRFVGRWLVTNPESNALALRLEERGVLTRTPHLPHEECLHLMHTAPVLLVLQPASPLQIPAKIYEYVAINRPLLVVGGEGATAALVEHHGLGRCCPALVPELKRLLAQLLTSPLRAPSASARGSFHYRELTRHLAARFDDAVAGRCSSSHFVPALGER